MDMDKVVIEKGIAKTMFVTAWADEMEERGRSFPAGSDVMHLAPRTPSVAILEAYRFMGALEQANKMSLPVLVNQAAKADGVELEEMPVSDKQEYLESFGHYMFMEALGHGVSWFDDHKKFDIEIPNYENPLFGHASTFDFGDSLAPR